MEKLGNGIFVTKWGREAQPKVAAFIGEAGRIIISIEGFGGKAYNVMISITAPGGFSPHVK